VTSADEPGRQAPRFVRASTNLLVLTPIRLALGVAGLAAAAVVGRPAPALLGFAVGTVGATVALSADRRYSRSLLGEIPTLPPDARLASRAEMAASGVFPSTVAVALLTLPALTVDATLAAVLAGVLAGMAVSGTIGLVGLYDLERRNGYALYVRRPGGGVFQSPRELDAVTPV